MTPLKLGLLLTLITTPALAQDREAGAALYGRHCAACHGATATGNGPMAPALLVQPTDLTQLSARNADVFPITRVVWRIDGRDPLVSHGSLMPIFGEFFETQQVMLRTEAGQPVLTSRPIADLVVYLESIQRPGE